MPVYQRCPFCDETFEIGPSDYGPMRKHIRVIHTFERNDGHLDLSSPPRIGQ